MIYIFKQSNRVFTYLRAIAAIIGILVPSNASVAATVTSTFQVSITVTTACTISVTNLAFGVYNLAQLNGTSTITVTCTNGTTYTVGLDGGTSAGPTNVTARKMINAGATASLSYALYSDSGRTINWGNSSGSWVSGTGTGATQTYTVYGRIPANQNTLIGNYSDTITATISF